MKIHKRDIVIIVIALVLIITANAWWRVKETGRRARFAAMQEAAMREAGAFASTDADAGARDGEAQ